MPFNLDDIKTVLNTPVPDNLPNDNKQDSSNPQTKGWEEVGHAAKEAVDRYSSTQKVDYVGVGALARKAADAYRAGDGKLDPVEIGKGIVAGALKGKTEEKTSQQVSAQEEGKIEGRC